MRLQHWLSWLFSSYYRKGYAAGLRGENLSNALPATFGWSNSIEWQQGWRYGHKERAR